jgi:YHS domain-containing protein
MLRPTHLVVSISVLSVIGLIIAGCSKPAAPPEEASKDRAEAPTPADHGHKASAHGGLIVAVGRDRYHAEAVFEKDGTLKLYTLDQDEARVLEVPVQSLKAHVRVEGGVNPVSFTLEPRPQEGDTAGTTSLFVGALPESVRGRKVEVTIVALRIGRDRFRVSFASPVAHAQASIPAKVKKDKEKQLYLTPGGRYTLEDVERNGKRTASEKFSDFDAAHDLEPKSGDPICPITLTKANAECSWIVGGRTYTFCCPPCVDEFVRRAKEKPDSIQPPESYRKK